MQTMFRRTWILTFAISIFAGPSLHGQDLDQLTNRVQQLWKARSSQSRRTEVLKFIDPQTHDAYLQNVEAPFSSFKLFGFEFTDDRSQVDVIARVRMLVPQIGEIDKTVKETWVWKDKQWFMRATTTPTLSTLFDEGRGNRPPQPAQPQFELSNTTIDGGVRTQGDVIEGKMVFKAPRQEIVVIRPVERIPGLSIGSPWWTDATTGYLTYRWETALLSESVDKVLPIEAIGTSGGKTSIGVRLQARIQGKVGFSQTPDIFDPATDGQVELHVRNLMDKPLRILSVTSNNPFYVVDDRVPESIDPGNSGRLLIRYTGHKGSGASLSLVLSEPLTASGIVTVPLNAKIPDVERPPSYTPETLEPLRTPTPPGFK
jgi:hypothetical protein